MEISPLTPEAVDVLETRGIVAEALASLGHIVASVKNDRGRQALGFRHRVDGGSNDHWAYRGIGEKRFWQSKGTKRVLWNNEIFDHEPDTVILTEGHLDALTLISIGFENTSSVPDGAPDKEDQATQTKYDYLEGIDWKSIATVILAFDGDGPGQILRDEVARRVGASRCKFVVWPQGCKDANDVLLDHGPDVLTRCINRARYIPMAGLVTLDQLPERAPEKPWSTGIDGLDEIWRPSPKRMTVLTGIPGHGKALDIRTPIPTPHGWTTMGDIVVGDSVLGDDGKPTKVVAATEVMFNRECFEIEFDDGERIIADADHLWLTRDEKARRLKRPSSVLTTRQISQSLTVYGKRNHQIHLTKPLEGVTSILPVDPYILGAWLGDGAAADGRIHCPDHAVRRQVGMRGFETTDGTSIGFGTKGLKVKLRRLGVLDNKHVPSVYLRAPYGDRLALLRGLMDTDGHAHAGDRRCEFSTTIKSVAESVHELACSLGIKPSLTTGRAKLNGRDMGEKYRVCFTTGLRVFNLARKAADQGIGIENRVNARVIRACRPVASVPVKCISVAAENKMYLCGRGFIPTHNTTFLSDVSVSLIEKENVGVAIASFEDDIQDSLVPRLIQRLIGKNIDDCSIPEIREAKAWINEKFVFIHPPDDDDDIIPDIHWFNDHAEAAALRKNCRLIILDPWNEIDHTTRPVDVNVTEYTGVMLKQLRQAAKRYGYHLIVAAHPRKMHKGSDGIPAMPNGYDIADSAHFMNKPDNGLTVHRGEGHRVTVNSWKCRRDGVIGSLGHRCFIFKSHEGRYHYDEMETFRPMG